MKLESRMRSPGPVRLTLLFLSAPSILMALVWIGVTLLGFTDTPAIRPLRGLGMELMTWLTIAAFISLLSALLVGPIVLGAVTWRWRRVAAPLALAAGAGAGAYAYTHVGGLNLAWAPASVLQVIGDSLAPLASLSAFVVASLSAAILLRLFAPQRRRGLWT